MDGKSENFNSHVKEHGFEYPQFPDKIQACNWKLSNFANNLFNISMKKNSAERQ